MRWKQGAAQCAVIQWKRGGAAVHRRRKPDALDVWKALVQIARPPARTIAAARMNRHRRTHASGEVAGEIDNAQRLQALKDGQPRRLKGPIDTASHLKYFGESSLRVERRVIDA